VRNGTATLEDGTLAGSVLTMDAGLRRLMGATGLSLAEIAPIFSTNAANQLGVNKGVLREGFDADVVLLDNRYHVGLTIALGEVVYARQQL
jgi:N-acetylglucosamine-6-phosphate deacetylase